MAQMKISPSRVPSLLRRLLPTLSDSSGSLWATDPRISRADLWSKSPSGMISPKLISPVVIVPVLSRQRVSTRAKSSTVASSLLASLRLRQHLQRMKDS